MCKPATQNHQRHSSSHPSSTSSPNTNRARRNQMNMNATRNGICTGNQHDQRTNNTSKRLKRHSPKQSKHKPCKSKAKCQPTSTSSSFVSVLSVPFVHWNALENLLSECDTDRARLNMALRSNAANINTDASANANGNLLNVNVVYRSILVQQLIQFLELKVLMEEYATEGPLLEPSPPILQAWKALVETKIPASPSSSTLYRETLAEIQDFHDRPKGILRFGPPSISYTTTDKTAADMDLQRRLDRTQILFQSYYQERMMESARHNDDARGSAIEGSHAVNNEDDRMSYTDTSTITDFNTPMMFRCGRSGTCGGTLSPKKPKPEPTHKEKNEGVADHDDNSHTQNLGLCSTLNRRLPSYQSPLTYSCTHQPLVSSCYTPPPFLRGCTSATFLEILGDWLFCVEDDDDDDDDDVEEDTNDDDDISSVFRELDDDDNGDSENISDDKSAKIDVEENLYELDDFEHDQLLKDIPMIGIYKTDGLLCRAYA